MVSSKSSNVHAPLLIRKGGQVPFLGLPIGFNVETRPNVFAIVLVQDSFPNRDPLLRARRILSNSNFSFSFLRSALTHSKYVSGASMGQADN